MVVDCCASTQAALAWGAQTPAPPRRPSTKRAPQVPEQRDPHFPSDTEREPSSTFIANKIIHFTVVYIGMLLLTVVSCVEYFGHEGPLGFLCMGSPSSDQF